jgi:hypothetical protein
MKLLGVFSFVVIALTGACRPAEGPPPGSGIASETIQRPQTEGAGPFSAEQEWVTYRDKEHHFFFEHPAGWTINPATINAPLARSETQRDGILRTIVVSLNSMGTEQFRFKQAQRSPVLWEFGISEILKQLPPGAVYFDVGWGPGNQWAQPGAEMPGTDLSALLKGAPEKTSAAEPLMDRTLRFSKWGMPWIITAYVREPYSQAQQATVERILASFRFDPALLEGEAKAVALSRKRLPPEAEPERYPNQLPEGPAAYSISVFDYKDQFVVAFTRHRNGETEQRWGFNVFKEDDEVHAYPPERPEEKNRILQTKMRDLPHSKWEPVQVAVYDSVSGVQREFSGKKATYTYEDVISRSKVTATVTCFISKSNHVWIGPEQPFYFETPAGIVGVTHFESSVFWAEPLTPIAQRSGKSTIDEVIAQFENGVTVGQLSSGLYENMSTHFHGFFQNPWAWVACKFCSGGGGTVRRAGFNVADGKLYLKVENPPTEFVGEVWIDIQTHLVTKATESGKQIFPP